MPEPAAGTCSERELVRDVDLCTPDGRLDPAAIGWARRPVHRCRMPGSWGRRKRWDFWGVTGPDQVLNLTIADLDYLGIVGGRDPGRRFEADVFVRRPEGHESLSVVIPWSARRFQCTTKDVARPAEGRVTWEGRTFAFEPDGRSWGCLDFGRGKWPYRSKWNWGAAAGLLDGADGPTRVGLQLGGKWTAGTGMTENALSIDGILSKISEELVWTYDTRDWLRPWTIRTPRSRRVDLTFTPVHDKVSRLHAGLVDQSIDQCFGRYEGTVVPDDGRSIRVGGIFGWAEEATWRW